MIQPSPEDFGLSNDTLPLIEAEQEKVAKRDGRAGCVAFLVGYGAVTAAFWPALGPLSFFFAIFPAGFAGIVIGAIVINLRPWLAYSETRRRLKRYNAYLLARKDYAAWFVKTQSTFWRSLTGLAFEREVASLCAKSGLRPRLTPASNDKGIDLVLGDGTIVQCKQHKNPVGPAVVRELYGALVASGASRAILISAAGFTPGVREFAKGKPIVLWDDSDLIRMQMQLTS